MKSNTNLLRTIALTILTMCMTMTSFAQFSGEGSGTKTNPYKITNAEELAEMAYFLSQSDVYFQLENDIDLNEWISENNPSQGWQPIGVASNEFQGHFDGKGHKITGLMINRSIDGVGIFGRINNATISNLTIINGDIRGKSHIGGLVGYAWGASTLENCNIELGTVIAGEYIGGIIGYAQYSGTITLNNCKVKGNIEGNTIIGGLIGYADGNHVQFTNCNANVTITNNSNNTGGFIGESKGTITANGCRFLGSITGKDNIGGIIGLCVGGSVSMDNCSAVGDIKGENYVGGLIGNSSSDLTLHTYEVRYYSKYISNPTTSTGTFYTSYSDETSSNNNSSKTIRNCSVVGNIYGADYIGGLIGYDKTGYGTSTSHTHKNTGMYYEYNYLFTDGIFTRVEYKNNRDEGLNITTYTYNLTYEEIQDNICSGSVTGKSHVGGIVGYKYGGSILHNISYSTIEGEKNIGGIVGTIDGKSWSSDKTTVKSNVAINPFIKSSTNTLPNRIIGNGVDYATIGTNGSTEENKALTTTKIYIKGTGGNDSQVKTIEDDSSNGQARGLSILQKMSTYNAAGYNFTDNWKIIDGNSFPYKQYQMSPVILDKKLESNISKISGTSNDGGTVYLTYNNISTPLSMPCNGTTFSFTTKPLIEGTIAKLYADNGEKVRSYILQNTIEKGTTILTTGVAITPPAVSIEKGETQQLTAIVSPSDATNKEVTWSSSNALIASVNASGLVTGTGVGTATITCTTVDGSEKFSTCAITVKEPTVKVSGITLDVENLNMETGQAKTLTPTITPANATNKNVTWTSDKPSVAMVSDAGVVTAKGAGTATITCTAADGSGKSATCVVTVKDPIIKVTNITLNTASINIEIGKNSTLTATVSPNNATDKGVTWTSYDPAIATVDNKGIVTAVTVGNTTIACTANDGSGVIATCKVTVVPKPVLVTGITLNFTTLTLETGKTSVLAPTITPANATNKEVTWSSNNTSVATVKTDGTVTAVGVGTATITCTAADGSGKSATCIVTVKAPLIKVSQITLNNTSLSLEIGKTSALTATVLPSNATDKSLAWTTYDSSIATVSNTGVVTAVAVGTTFIACTSTDGSNIVATCEVSVTPKPILITGITLNKTALNLETGETSSLIPTIVPTNATNRNVIWTSDKPSVATVSDAGIVIAKGTGTATITCTAADGSGKTAKCTVTVTAPPVIVSEIILNNTSLSIEIGKSSTLTATVLPTNASNKNVSWTTNNPTVATVSNSGVVTANATGTAIIVCTATDGSGVATTCEVTVTPKPILITSISLNNTTLELETEETSTLVPIIVPTNATNKNVIWTSDKPSVATVNDAGVVTAKGTGTATITCTTTDGSEKTAKCTVTVKAPAIKVSQITLSNTYLTIERGKTSTLSATVLPSNANNKIVNWASTNTSVATVNNAGVVTAIAIGTATITCTADDGSGTIAMCSVSVVDEVVLVTGITLNNTTLNLETGQSSTLTPTITPTNATNKHVIWTSNKESVAIVSSTGEVTGMEPGTATITCTAADGSGKKATCLVTVKAATISVSQITLNNTSLNMMIGNSATLTATVLPINATNKNVTWSSSNTSVATVSNSGVVNAIGTGTANITCTAKDGSGKTATCIVTVTQPAILVEQITLNKTNVTLAAGATTTLTATIMPNNASSKITKWTSSNENIATVNSNGVVTAITEGVAYIYCTATDGSGISATCTITVTATPTTILVSQITLNNNTINIEEGKTSTLSATISPSNAANKTLNWSSSNSNIAAVNNSGLVTAISKGTAIIYCSATDGSGVSATCTINVTESSMPSETRTITLNGSNAWSTWVGNENLSTVAGLEAYVITSVNTSSGIVTAAKQTVIKAGTPMLLHRTSNATTFTLPILDNAILNDIPSDLYFAATSNTSVASLTSNGQVIYILVNDEFIRTRSGVIPAGKCYLALTESAAARISIMFTDDEMTQIIVKGKNSSEEIKRWSTIGGQRINEPKRAGLYIMNGKKVVIK